MSGLIRIRVRFEKAATKWFDWLMVSHEEMKELLKGTVWRVSESIDSEDSGYIAVIRKVISQVPWLHASMVELAVSL